MMGSWFCTFIFFHMLVISSTQESLYQQIQQYEKEYKSNILGPFEATVQLASTFVTALAETKRKAKEAGEDPEDMVLNFDGAEEELLKLESYLVNTSAELTRMAGAIESLKQAGNTIQLKLLDALRQLEDEKLRLEKELKIAQAEKVNLTQMGKELEAELQQRKAAVEQAAKDVKAAQKAYDDQSQCAQKRKRFLIVLIVVWVVCSELDRKKNNAQHQLKHKQSLLDETKNEENKVKAMADKVKQRLQEIEKNISNLTQSLTSVNDSVQELRGKTEGVFLMQGTIYKREAEIKSMTTQFDSAINSAKFALIRAGMEKAVEAAKSVSEHVVGGEKMKQKLKDLPSIK